MRPSLARLFSTSARALKDVTATQVRQQVFQAMKDAYVTQNKYAQAYFESKKINIADLVSDHTAIRTNSLQGMANAGRFFYALQMESFEDEKTKGFKKAFEEAIKTGDFSVIEKMEWPYNFLDKGLRSTHFDIADNPIEKGIQQKIFVSTINPNVFADEEVRKKIAQDQKYFSNDFSPRGKELVKKLEEDQKLTEEESAELVQDWMEVFSKRQVPMLLSTYEAIKGAKLREDIKNPLPVISGIGSAFSGVRNHHTPMVGYEIAQLPQELAAIGVPPGSPPVQYDGGIVQTSSQGIPQEMEYIDDNDADDYVAARAILESDKSSADKRAALLEKGLIKTMVVNHEYVEYIKRAQYAKVEVDGSEKVIPVWLREDGKCYSALSQDQDREGLLKGKYPNGFDSYTKEVALKELLFDDKGQPILVSGFTANNATNIFLGTAEVKAPRAVAQPLQTTELASGRDAKLKVGGNSLG